MRRTNLSVAEQLTRESARGQMQSMKCTDDAKESFRHKPYSYDTSVTSQNRSELILNNSTRKIIVNEVRHGSEVIMEEEVKEQIKAMLLLLANTLQNNGVSMATDTKGNLYFFDTANFLKNREYSGLKVNIQELVCGDDEVYTEPL